MLPGSGPRPANRDGRARPRLDHLNFGESLSTNSVRVKNLSDLRSIRQKAILVFILEADCLGCVSPAPFLGANQALLAQYQTTMIVHFVKTRPKRDIEVKYNNILFYFDDVNLAQYFAPETLQISNFESTLPRARPIYIYVFLDQAFKTWKKKTVYSRPMSTIDLKSYLE
jgi:hypothetical protein